MTIRFHTSLIRSAVPIASWHELWPTLGETGLRNENIPVQFKVKAREDLWEILRDGKLVGGYVSRMGALEAARSAIQRVFSSGGSAELIADPC